MRSINEVLDEEERKRIHEIEEDIPEANSARILENVMHIECIAPSKDVAIATYISLRSYYAHVKIRGTKYFDLPEIPNEDDLKKRRQDHHVFGSRRHEILLDELKIRTDDILAHKWYLSEAEGADVGLVKAAAHWLRSVSPEFYARSKAHHAECRMDFEWMGMEKAVCICAPNQQGLPACYTIVRERDIHYEERLTQLGGGLSARKDSEETGASARQKFIELEHTKHFFVLGRKEIDGS